MALTENISNKIKEVINRPIDIFSKMIISYMGPKLKMYNKEDIEALIRDINILNVLGKVDLTPNLSKIDKNSLERCRILSDKGAVIGGSLLLKSCGLLDREHDDIDILWDISKAREDGLLQEKLIVNTSTDYSRDDQDFMIKSDQEIVRYKINSDEFGTLDIFDIDEPVHITIGGINFTDPIKTLRVKFKYYRDKDKYDFYTIKSKIDKL